MTLTKKHQNKKPKKPKKTPKKPKTTHVCVSNYIIRQILKIERIQHGGGHGASEGFVKTLGSTSQLEKRRLFKALNVEMEQNYVINLTRKRNPSKSASY